MVVDRAEINPDREEMDADQEEINPDREEMDDDQEEIIPDREEMDDDQEKIIPDQAEMDADRVGMNLFTVNHGICTVKNHFCECFCRFVKAETEKT
jgi:hypothetical protein